MTKKRNEGTVADATEETGGDKRVRPPRTAAEVAVDWAKSIGAAVLLFLVLRTFLVQTFVITSSSMEPTLLVGDFLVLSKAAYGPRIPLTDAHLPGYSDPEAGDVVVFRPPHDPDLDVVKRLVGMPGDTLEMRDKVLHINGTRRDEPYARYGGLEDGDMVHPWMRWQCGESPALGPDISGGYRIPADGQGSNGEECHPTRDNWGPVVVPEGHYFMMGDNRDDSVDSRYWGFLERDRLRGEALMIYYSYDSQL
nr:signal peptidase I [Gemmatimonadota bacterium]NIU72888.1 signal peptidase I [Gammaproteobacteria bacterium]NIP82153.1 signal peptidase I [Gemmatimonadota bacterium]NIQ52750.1 signal peptidase I [Gemmatimonadota bacterium]NIX47067.1 signal peptidase I [Gemmatimonadota bacterium]